MELLKKFKLIAGHKYLQHTVLVLAILIIASLASGITYKLTKNDNIPTKISSPTSIKMPSIGSTKTRPSNNENSQPTTQNTSQTTSTSSTQPCTQHSCLSCSYVKSIADPYYHTQLSDDEQWYQQDTSSQTIGETDSATQAEIIQEVQSEYSSRINYMYTNYLSFFQGLDNPCSPDLPEPSLAPPA